MLNLWKRLRTYLPYLAGALALAGGMYAWLEVKYFWEDKYVILPLMMESEEWISAKGSILEQHVRSEVKGRFSHMPVTHYFGAVRYAYEVNGVKYTGEKICFQDNNCGYGESRQGAAALLSAYPEGRAVTVYHAPQDPRRSVLLPGVRNDIHSRITTHLRNALLALLVTAGLIIFVIRTAPEFRNASEKE